MIEIDGASNTSVNDVREIRDEVLFAPNAARYKVYIIDEVHMLSNSAFNALLKTIEEPPPYIVFIFATTEVHKVPATIRSRCQQYNFRLISTGEIKEKLREAAGELGVQAEDRALIWIAKEATGSLRDAYTLLDQVVSFAEGSLTLERIREKLGVLGIDELNDFARLFRAGDAGKVLERTDAVLASGVSIEQFVANLAEYFRNLLFLKSGIAKDTLLGYSPRGLRRGGPGVPDPGQIEKAIELLLALYRNLRFSLNQRFELELLLTRLAQLDSLITPSRGPRRSARDAGAASAGARGRTRLRRSASGQPGSRRAGRSASGPAERSSRRSAGKSPHSPPPWKRRGSGLPGRGGSRPYIFCAGPIPGRGRAEGPGYAHGADRRAPARRKRGCVFPTATPGQKPRGSTRGWSCSKGVPRRGRERGRSWRPIRLRCSSSCRGCSPAWGKSRRS